MFYWTIYNSLLFINFFNIIQMLLDITSTLLTLLECFYLFKMCHFVYIWFTWAIRIYVYDAFERKIVFWIFVFKRNLCLFIYLSFESYVEVSYFIFKDIWHWFRIGYYTLNKIRVIIELYFADNWGKWISEKLNNFLRRILMIHDKSMMPFSFLCTSFNKSLRGSISYSYSMNSSIFDILSHNVNNLLCIWYLSISKKKYLFRITINNLLIECKF